MTSLDPSRAATIQLDLPDGLVHVRPDGRYGAVDDTVPVAVVVTSWCPGDQAALFADDDRRQSELTAAATRLGFEPCAAAVFNRDGRWHLAGVALQLAGEEADFAGFRLASFAAQDRYRLLGPDGVTEVFLKTGQRRTTSASSTAVPRRTCPVPDGKDGACRKPDGTYAGLARFNVLSARARRHSAVRALGCDDCGGCNLAAGGRGVPIALVPLYDPAPGDERRSGEVHEPGYGGDGYTPRTTW